METDAQGLPLKLSQEELEEAEDELLQIMHDRFMNGEDVDWVDYAQIDADDELDDLEQIDRDQEDHWFNQEDQE